MSWLNKFLYKMMQNGGKELAIADQERRVMAGNVTGMERLFSENIPAIVAFKIDNGYVVRIVDMSNEVQLGGFRTSGFWYCKDHTAIADHIVSESAKEKLGLSTAASVRSNVPPAVQADYAAKTNRR